MEAPQGGAQGEASQATGQEANAVSPPLSPASAAAAAQQNTRWNPTMEQVAVLERLYEHGVSTPTADQIQHITGRLREHGPIEAKNVFYWFQNHKARDRSKQKQEGFAYFTRMLRRAPSLPVMARPPGPLGRMPASPPELTMAPPSAAAACSNGSAAGTHVMFAAPYYMPAPAPQASVGNAGYYNLPQAHFGAAVYPRMDITQDKHMIPTGMNQAQAAAPYNNLQRVVHPATSSGASAGHRAGRGRETLELFPLRPTFVLPDNNAPGAAASLTPSTPSAASPSFSGGESVSAAESPDSSAEAPPPPFYDFLGLQSADR